MQVLLVEIKKVHNMCKGESLLAVRTQVEATQEYQ